VKEDSMNEHLQVAVEPSGCPFAMPAIPSREQFAAFYCRLPGGRVRIPTPEERMLFCHAGRYDECPVVRRYAFCG
jgi:hypothetical protein